MRCIETKLDWSDEEWDWLINYNMRCIETIEHDKHNFLCPDKLQHEMYWNEFIKHAKNVGKEDKLQHEMYWNSANSATSCGSPSINYNMRCIETYWIALKNTIWLDKLQHEMYWNTE